jgi:hypothetical protein
VCHEIHGGDLLDRNDTLGLAVLALVFTTGLVIVLSSGDTYSLQTPLAVGYVQGGLRYSVALQKTTFNIGEPVNVTFTITNVSNKNITNWHSAWDFDFVVYNGSNSKLFQWSAFRVFPMIIWGSTLRPGDSFESVLVWPQTCNETQNSGGVQVSPGNYFIVGILYGVKTLPLEISIRSTMPLLASAC